MSRKQPNALEVLLYQDSSVLQTQPVPTPEHPYANGMAVTINSHKRTTLDLLQSMKEVYGTLLYGLTGKNPSKDHVMVKHKLPSRQKVLDLVASKTPLMVAGIHSYNQWDKTTGKGSYANYGYQHLHLYAYGVHHYLPLDGVAGRVEILRQCFKRHLHQKKKAPDDAVQIKPVGIGKYLYEFNLTPTTLYDYLNLPSTNCKKDSWINYLAEYKPPGEGTPLFFIYKQEN